jgi:hypothetical protein
MDLQSVKEMIETRMSAENGNYTEKSLMWEIHTLLLELEERRKNDEMQSAEDRQEDSEGA